MAHVVMDRVIRQSRPDEGAADDGFGAQPVLV
jgi:hypothetical protein